MPLDPVIDNLPLPPDGAGNDSKPVSDAGELSIVGTHPPADAGAGEAEPSAGPEPGAGADGGDPVDPPSPNGSAGPDPVTADRQGASGPGGSEEDRAATVNMSGGSVQNLQNATGHGNVLNNIYVETGKNDKGNEKPIAPLEELTSRLPLQRRPAGRFASGDVEIYCRKLLDERLLLISCIDRTIALAAAHEVAAAVDLPPEQARLLNFDSLRADDGQLTIYTLLKAPNEGEVEVLVMVDAVSHAATSFLDSLLGARGLWSSDALKASLAEEKLLILCLAEPQRCVALEEDDYDLPFAHWPVPFLEHLLRPVFPNEHLELARTILQQRQQGRWSRNDREFWREVRISLAQGTLRDLVGEGGLPVGAKRDLPLGADRPMHSAALFTAVYLPGLRRHEFRRVVTAALADETVRASPAAADGAETSKPRKDRRLAEVWIDEADQIVRDCYLTLDTDADLGSVVGFFMAGELDRARATIEDAHQFYVDRWFDAIHRAGLLFDVADAIAAAVVGVTVEVLSTFPYGYATRWVIDRLADAEKTGLRPGQRIKRLAELLRALGEREETRPIVDGVLEQLLADGASDAVLMLTRRLRFAPTFDAFRWMRQLLDRGNETVRWATYWLLYGELMGMERQVYPVLRTVATWLPPATRAVGNYSPSNRLALRLLLEYALDSAEKLEEADYGAWPSRYPLFAAASADALAADMELLAGWLLHPGMKSTPDRGEADREATMNLALATLIAEWTFILYGPKGQPVGTPDAAAPAPPCAEPDAAATEIGPDAVLTALLEAILAATADPRGREIRRALLAIWDALKTFAAEQSSAHRDRRDELAWQRRLVRMLALRFRALQQATPGAPTAHATPA